MDKLINQKTFGQLGPKITETQFKSLKILCVSGNKSMIYVTEEDEVYCLGDNLWGCLGLGVSADHIPSPKLNTTLSGQQLVDICFGFYYGIALTSSGQCWSWGNNEFGQLGNSNERSTRTPQLIDGLSDERVVRICCGNAHNLIVTDSGQLYAWGRNGFGQIGDNTFADCFRPTLIRIDDKVVSVSCGKYHSTALTDTGLVYVWGGNKFGQLGQRLRFDSSFSQPLLLDSSATLLISKVFCGSEHTVLLTSDGDVYAFGRNDCGQVGNGLRNDQFFPVRINDEIKFKDIATACGCDITIGLSNDDKYYYWGLCDNKPVLRPREVVNYSSVMQSLFEVFARFAKFKITYKTIVVDNELKNGLEQIDDKTDDKTNVKTETDIEMPLNESKESEINNSKNLVNNSNHNNDSNVSETPKPLNQLSNKITKTNSNPLINFFSKSFNNPSNSDIHFRITGQLVFGHKTILSIRNEKFWNNYEKYLDKDLNEIVVEDYSYGSFLAFIQYLYTNVINITDESVADLLSLANIYEEEELKENCCQLLANSIDSTNVCQLYSKAVEQNINELSKYCSEYVSRNFKQIILSKEFEDLNDSLSKQLIISSLSIKSKTRVDKPEPKRVSKETTNEQMINKKKIKSKTNN